MRCRRRSRNRSHSHSSCSIAAAAEAAGPVAPQNRTDTPSSPACPVRLFLEMEFKNVLFDPLSCTTALAKISNRQVQHANLTIYFAVLEKLVAAAAVGAVRNE